MAGWEKRHFPLGSIQDVVSLFRDQLEYNNGEPNLALLSIVLGAIENTLTVNRAISADVDADKNLQPIFPAVDWLTVEALYQKFVAVIQGSVDLTIYKEKHTSRDLVKRVSDVIWGQLPRSYYKDKAHLQSLYSFLTGWLQVTVSLGFVANQMKLQGRHIQMQSAQAHEVLRPICVSWQCASSSCTLIEDGVTFFSPEKCAMTQAHYHMIIFCAATVNG